MINSEGVIFVDQICAAVGGVFVLLNSVSIKPFLKSLDSA